MNQTLQNGKTLGQFFEQLYMHGHPAGVTSLTIVVGIEDI